MRKIKFTLDTVGDAIKEVNAYKKEFIQKVTDFVWALTDRGADIAVEQIVSLGAFDSGELANSIKAIMYVEGNKGVVFTDCPYAAFIEFGVGVVGSDTPHPTMPWEYDVNKHGEAGWVYYDEKNNRFRWTKGMPSRPFMYNTMQELASEAVKIAKDVFR